MADYLIECYDRPRCPRCGFDDIDIDLTGDELDDGGRRYTEWYGCYCPRCDRDFGMFSVERLCGPYGYRKRGDVHDRITLEQDDPACPGCGSRIRFNENDVNWSEEFGWYAECRCEGCGERWIIGFDEDYLGTWQCDIDQRSEYHDTMMIRGTFDDQNGHAYKGYFDPGYEWNGASVPFFTHSVAGRIAAEYRPYPGKPEWGRMFYDQSSDSFLEYDINRDPGVVWIDDDRPVLPSDLEYTSYPGIDMMTEDGIRHLYAIGGASWLWECIRVGGMLRPMYLMTRHENNHDTESTAGIQCIE